MEVAVGRWPRIPVDAALHHRRALEIARDINAPLEEARALEGIGRSHLHQGNDDQGVSWLHQSLTIYQRIRAPAAERIQETLCNLKLTESSERPLCDTRLRSPSLHDPSRPREASADDRDLLAGGLPGPWLAALRWYSFGDRLGAGRC